jgi:ABC-type transporter lipoprotein component MlaA
VDQLGQLKQAEDASIDFYSFVRSSYYQMRRAELREALGQQGDVDSPALAELDDPAAPAAPARNQSASAAKGSAAASTKATP